MNTIYFNKYLKYKQKLKRYSLEHDCYIRQRAGSVSEPIECAICHMSDNPEDMRSCNHGKIKHPNEKFHLSCLQNWFIQYKKKTCPYCMTVLSEEEIKKILRVEERPLPIDKLNCDHFRDLDENDYDNCLTTQINRRKYRNVIRGVKDYIINDKSRPYKDFCKLQIKKILSNKSIFNETLSEEKLISMYIKRYHICCSDNQKLPMLKDVMATKYKDYKDKIDDLNLKIDIQKKNYKSSDDYLIKIKPIEKKMASYCNKRENEEIASYNQGLQYNSGYGQEYKSLDHHLEYECKPKEEPEYIRLLKKKENIKQQNIYIQRINNLLDKGSLIKNQYLVENGKDNKKKWKIEDRLLDNTRDANYFDKELEKKRLLHNPPN